MKQLLSCLLLASIPLLSEAQAQTQAIEPAESLAVFAPGEKAAFNISVEPPFSCKALDFDGACVFESKAGAKELEIPALANGYYELSVERDGKELAKKPFAVIPLPDPKADRSRNQFGAMVIPHTRYPMADRERDAQFMNRIGVRWVRTHRLNWIHLQAGPDKPVDWKSADAEMEIYKRFNLDVVATTCWPMPQWASSGAKTKLSPIQKSNMAPAPEFFPMLEGFCSALAARYKGRIAYYEIGNEVDASNFWQGSAEHSTAGDKEGVMKDYCEHFLRCAKALKKGDPDAIVAPNTTGAAPEGHSYKPWLETMYKYGIDQEMNAFSTHYMADLDAIREIMGKHGQGNLDIILTELGGFVKRDDCKMSREDMEKVIKISYVHYAAQLNKGAKALCKFMLRELPGIKNPDLGGMLEADFSLRPEFVAFATMIRMIGDAEPVKELNVTKLSDKGWLEAYSYLKGGKTLSLVILQDAAEGTAILDCPGETQVQVVDVMGRSFTAPVENSKLTLKMKGTRPLFVCAALKEQPGPVEHPKPVVVKELELPLENPSFESQESGRIPGWSVFSDEVGGGSQKSMERFQAFIDISQGCGGAQSLCFSATKQTEWYGVMCKLPLNMVPRPQTGQSLEIEISYDQKAKDVKGVGAGINIAFRKKDFSRIWYACGNWDQGSFDWTHKSFKAKIQEIPAETEFITLEPTLGKSTGTVWYDNFKPTLRLWQTGAAETRAVH